MFEKLKAWVLSFLVVGVVAGVVFLLWSGWSQIAKLAAFTYFYSGVDIFAKPSFAIPRLPPARGFELIGHVGGAPSAVAIRGRYAYAGYGTELAVVDITEASRPQFVAALTLLGRIKAITVSGDNLYVADGRGGARIVDIADPLSPRELANFGYRSAVKDLAVGAGVAYLAAGVEGVQVLDCADAGRPRLANFRDQAMARGGMLDSTRLACAGQYLYEYDGGKGVRILDVSRPLSPRTAGMIDLGEGGDFVLAAEGECLVAASGSISESLSVYRAAAGRLSKLSTIMLSRYCYSSGAVVQAGYIYLATSKGLVVVDARNPHKPAKLAELPTNAPLAALDVSGDRVCAVSNAGDFIVFDVARKNDPRVLGVMNQPGAVLSAGVCRESLIVASSPGALFRLPLAGHDGRSAKYMAACDYPRFVAAAGGRVAVDHESNKLSADNRDWLLIGELKGEEGLLDRREIPVPGSKARPAFTDNLVAAAGYRGLHMAAINQGRPGSVVSFLPCERGVEVVAGKENLLFIGVEKNGIEAELRIYDAGQPGGLRLLATAPLAGSVDGLSADGNYLYVTAGPFLGKNKLIVFDISSPPDSKKVSECELFGGTLVEVDRGVAYVNEVGRVAAFDVSDPARPLRIGEIETTAVPMSVTDLRAAGGLLYVCADDCGLYIYRLRKDVRPLRK